MEKANALRTRCALLVTIAVGLPLSAAGACRLVKLGEVPIRFENFIVVDVSLNGHATQLIVDTAGQASLLFQPAIDRYELKRMGAAEGSCGTGGCNATKLVAVKDFALAEYVVHDLRFAASPASIGNSQIAGLLGQDFLSKFDVEFDRASNRMRLFQPQGCNGDLAYWTDAYAMVKLDADHSERHWLQGPVSLNGHQLMALFDTGTNYTTVLTRVTQRSGLAPETPLEHGGRMGGVGLKTLETSHARFSSITVGQETVQHPELTVADVFANVGEVHLGSLIEQTWFQEPDIVVGADFFRAHRVYIANSQGKIYFTYLGGVPYGPVAAPDKTVPPASPQQ
jgi:hypothetical protein